MTSTSHPDIYRSTFPFAGATACPYIDRIWSEAKGEYIDRPESKVPAEIQQAIRELIRRERLLKMKPATERIQ